MTIPKRKLQSITESSWEIYRHCQLCPRKCSVHRIAGETGICGQTSELKITAALQHFGEEPPLSGENGVGNIFITGCSLSCAYCQNYQASQENLGEIITPPQLAMKMLQLQAMKVNYIGWVTPSHVVPGLFKSLALAYDIGFNLPLIYNTNSYDNIDTLRILQGIVDVYLADLRYSSDECAVKYSAADHYVNVSRNAVEEMFRQVGPFNNETKAKKGLIIRLLVLPENIAGLWDTLCFIALELSKKIPLSLMSQYQPVYRASEFPELNRFITQEEYNEVLKMAKSLGFETIFTQELSRKNLLPDFRKVENSIINPVNK